MSNINIKIKIILLRVQVKICQLFHSQEMHVKDCQCNPLLVLPGTNLRICIAYVWLQSI